MKQTHTPGPWVFESGVNAEMMTCVTSPKLDGGCEDIAYLTLPNHAANARLIAAAPYIHEAALGA